MSEKEIVGLHSIWGPIIVLKNSEDIALGEIVEITDNFGSVRKGRVLKITEELVFIQVFGPTQSLSVNTTRVKFLGKPFLLGVSEEMLGRIFDGKGVPLDGAPPVYTKEKRDIYEEL